MAAETDGLGARSEQRGFANSSVIAPLGPAVIATLDGRATRRALRAGDVLFRRGDPGDSVYLVETGRLEVRGRSAGADAVVAELGRGDLVGEMSVLSDLPRTATVIACRDSRLLRLDRHDFAELMAVAPEIGVDLANLVVTRVMAPPPERVRRPSTVAVMPVALDPARVDVVLGALEQTARIGVTGASDHARHEEHELLEHLDRLEREFDLLVYDGRGEPAWRSMAVRHADLVVAVVDARTAPGAVADFVRRDGPIRGRLDLAVVHDTGTAVPPDGARWTKHVDVQRIHHCVVGDRGTTRRLGRLVSGDATGVLFSGGGARGLAHLGAWRALVESGTDVDAVGGVSIGALFSGAAALDYDPDVLHAEVDAKLVRRGAIFDPTLPVAAVFRGARLSRLLEEVAQDRTFENSWRSSFATSANLTTGAIEVHRRGPHWKAIRASMSIPGLFPPCRSGDAVLVDGAVFSNMPAPVMRDLHPGIRVIGIDVGTHPGDLLAQDLPDTGEVSGWRWLAHRATRRSRHVIPNLAQLMLRIVDVGTPANSEPPDLLVRPAVDGIPLLAFKEIDRLAAAGYDATKRALTETVTPRAP
jgi:NTE family protein